MRRYLYLVMAIFGFAESALTIAKPLLPPPAVHSIDPRDPTAPFYPKLRRDGMFWRFSTLEEWRINIGREAGGHCSLANLHAENSIVVGTFLSGQVRFIFSSPKLNLREGESVDLSYGFDGTQLWANKAASVNASFGWTVGGAVGGSAVSDELLNAFATARTLNVTVNGQRFDVPLANSATAIREMLRCQNYIAQERKSSGIRVEDALAAPVPQIQRLTTENYAGQTQFSTVGNWQISTLTSVNACVARASFADGTTIDILSALNSEQPLLGIGNPLWNLTTSDKHRSTIQFDDDPAFPVTVVPIAIGGRSSKPFQASVSSAPGKFATIWKKELMRFNLDGHDAWYRLDGAAAASQELQRCRAALE